MSNSKHQFGTTELTIKSDNSISIENISTEEFSCPEDIENAIRRKDDEIRALLFYLKQYK